MRSLIFNRWGAKLGIALSVAAFSFIYASLWGFVGRFPAESVAVSQANAMSLHALCYNPQDTQRNISVAPVAFGHSGAGVLSIPVQRTPTSGGQLGQIAGSRALFYSVFNNTIYVINKLDPADVSNLANLVYWGILSPTDVSRVKRAAASFTPNCSVPLTDLGVTEMYWATKGTAVIHHWGYLYDSSFSDGKPIHAQYGFLVSRTARAIADALGMPGPTGFVRVAWAVYWFIGVVYILAFLYVFRANIAIASVGLAWQIAAFASVDAFSVLLAPGYHWSRELVMILPPVLLELIPAISGQRDRRIVGVTIASLFFAAIGYALDPTFTLVAVASLALALVAYRWRDLRNSFIARPVLAAAAPLVIALAVLALLATDASNIAYVSANVSEYASSALADSARTSRLVFNLIAAAIAISLTAWRRVPLIAGYFGILSVIVYAFYVITPDNFHFAKYVEYVVPLYVALGIALHGGTVTFSRFVPGRHLWLSPASRLFATTLILVTLFLLSRSVQEITALPDSWALRTVDSEGIPYFTSRAVTINGRLLNADVNDETVARLRSFPVLQATRYVISPLDKYLLFLYDVHNGFDSVDATAWMDSDSKLSEVEGAIIGRHATATIDAQVFRVNPTAALLSTNPVLGTVNMPSVFNVKSRIRINELAAFLASRCALSAVGSSRSWYIARC